MAKNRNHTPNTLPSHIIVQILYRTPVKSLGRFRCVSKRWYFLISHPKFIRNHFHFNKLLNTHIIFNSIVRNHTDTNICMLQYNKPLVSLLRIENKRIGSKIREWPYELTFDDFSKDMVIAGSVNGVVCLSHDKEFFGSVVALWNPAVKCSKLIALRDLRTGFEKWESMSVGLGFDEVGDDYKIFFIVPVVIPPEFEERRWSRVEIYSAKRGYWRNVEGGQGVCFPFWPKFSSCNFVVNGVPYWVGFHEGLEDKEGFDPCKEEILGAFDPHTEVFKKVAYPVLVRNEGTYVHPVNYRDSVAALVLSPGQCPNSMVDLYMLDENSSDWTKIYTIGPFSFKIMSIPQCFRTGELVVNKWEENGDWDRNLYYCDPTTNCVFPATEFDTLIPLWSQSYSYAESLVGVKGMQLTGNEYKIKKVQAGKKTWTISLPDDFEAVFDL
ncbi:hypothetical protein POM88_053063 [Heracleum sosnowskyi]|uniref:F-box domain-containing protein n=1 Tax=Heracleum sosnowskyi TaxID=360622 RepID=A0AAD8GQN1_9APIA|nr:hypothetical protein POM88_053063 [Heracleum sosnowskyi]